MGGWIGGRIRHQRFRMKRILMSAPESAALMPIRMKDGSILWLDGWVRPADGGPQLGAISTFAEEPRPEAEWMISALCHLRLWFIDFASPPACMQIWSSSSSSSLPHPFTPPLPSLSLSLFLSFSQEDDGGRGVGLGGRMGGPGSSIQIFLKDSWQSLTDSSGFWAGCWGIAANSQWENARSGQAGQKNPSNISRHPKASFRMRKDLQDWLWGEQRTSKNKLKSSKIDPQESPASENITKESPIPENPLESQ